MNDSFGGEFVQTQAGQAGAASGSKGEGIAPVLIKQIFESSEGAFKLWNLSFGLVSISAIVRSIETSSTKVTYSLEDHTGRIDGHYWLEEGNASKAPDVMIDNYAKVYGSIRSQGGNKTLMIFKLVPISDPNEICTHILEMLNARYSAEAFSHVGSGMSEFENTDQNTESTNTAIGLDSKQQMLLNAIKSYASDEGISRNQLQMRFNHVNKNEINEILDFMTAEGHIYSSIDPDHFRSTE
ncbi:replication protein A 32 kDa subunit [Teleopsis dalmanni]|uniref:replication protein A 32 kDa subunit n=1 Tax=Teleopsis dalmanni TaxID=139649 RepID=UPI000D329E72|nr:replication protein A 32 kDa subunit [Teleopsis dalmanni]